jgi:6-phosphogluconate dehydrogenase
VSRIWKGRLHHPRTFLDKIKGAYQRRADLPNLLLDPDFNAFVQQSQPNWRRAVTTAIQSGVAVPGMSASIGYFDTYRTANLPLNLTQAQRDFFGSHTYERTDKPGQPPVHTEWEEMLKKG